jgi:hypothetical protein
VSQSSEEVSASKPAELADRVGDGFTEVWWLLVEGAVGPVAVVGE